MSGGLGKTVLVVGSGGREHALAWKLAQSPSVSRVIVAPGNAGMPESLERWSVALGTREDFAALARRAREACVDLAVIGPDNPLALGIVDVFEREGVRCFGPHANAARIEASKAFAKELMSAAGVPTARHFVAHSAVEADRILATIPWGSGWVIKADGLALGKGVRVCDEREGAVEAARELIKITGSLVIEERVAGEEISWMAFCDGSRCALLEPARDYKRLCDGARGPNTGGMGSFSPVPGIPGGFGERIRREVFLPVLREMARRGVPFRGVLYAGLMTDFASDRYWVLEFNARFGDPEAQVLLPRIEGDLYPWLEACAVGDLSGLPERVPFCGESAVYVVAAARGYPEQPEKGQAIRGPLKEQGYFSAGVGEGLVTSGGRVFGALGMGIGLAEARAQAYSRLGMVSFDGMQYRSDIAEGADGG